RHRHDPAGEYCGRAGRGRCAGRPGGGRELRRRPPARYRAGRGGAAADGRRAQHGPARCRRARRAENRSRRRPGTASGGPMSEPVLIAQISDLHVKRPGENAYAVSDTAAALKKCVAELNRLRPRPAIVVITGDLVDTRRDEEYAHLTTLLAPLELPFCAVPGNHDARAP